ncbi:MAG: hypothetical protein AB7L92_08045 [Alphaproteobacteria bacterium]
MPAAMNIELTRLLRERMEDLLFEVVEMQDYLSEIDPTDKEGHFPLGVMGQVMSAELQHEALAMMEKTEDVICKAEADSWEKTRTSVYLNRKLATLELFMRIIAQLPATNISAHHMAEQMAGRIHARCKSVEDALIQMARQSVTQTA